MGTTFDHRSRIARAAAALRVAGGDALVISHLPNLRYLSGLELSAGTGVLFADGRLALLVDSRYEAAAREQADVVGTDCLVAILVGEGQGAGAGSTTEWIVRTCIQGGVGTLAVEPRVLSWHAARHLQVSLETAGWSGVLLDGSLDLIEDLRRVKDAQELAWLKEGGARLSEVVRQVLDARIVAVGRTELEVAADVDARVRALGFSRAAFETIVASGPRSALPHARPTDRRLEAGDVVVLDFGGVYGGYCVDLTRTLCLGHPSSEVDRQYHAVLAAQRAGCDAVKPGVLPSDVDRAARQVLEAAGLGEVFGHGTGHGLGLEVHEAPRLARPRTEEPAQPTLEAGVVCTIEPGAYVTGRAGIRIEDDVLVTTDGHLRITDAPLGWPTAH